MTLKSLTFAPLPKLSAADPVVHRRNKLIVRLQQQIALANDPNFAITRSKWIADEHDVKQLRELRKKVRPWWRTDATGNVVLSCAGAAHRLREYLGTVQISAGM